MNPALRPKISVVIPAYNAAKRLRVAVESVLRQTLGTIEVWVVNDGSADSTGTLADGLLRTDARVRVLHQPNRGAYMARLNALRRIKAPYFAFLDADDRIEPQMYKSMLEWAEAEHLDVVQCRQYGDVRADGSRTILGDRKAIEQHVVRPFLLEGRGALFVWDKLYRNIYDFSKFVNAPITMFDDMVLNLQFFRQSRRMGLLNEGLYHYQVNDGSSVRNYKPKNLEDFLYTIRYRTSSVGAYCWQGETRALDCWIVLNARNQLVSAASAKADSWRVRMTHVRAILVVAPVRRAYDALLSSGSKANRRLLVELWFAYWAPVAYTLLCCVAKRLRQRGRR